MSEQKERGEEFEHWASSWERQCVDQFDSEPNLDDRIVVEREETTKKLWLAFQNCATSVTQLYKARASNHSASPAVWIAFQNAASTVAQLYKDSIDMNRRNTELGLQLGHQRRNRDLVAWAKKRRRHICREDLLAHLCGARAPPSRSRHNHRVVTSDRASPRVLPTEPFSQEPDLQPFREALALQGLNGAMAGISMGGAQAAVGGQSPYRRRVSFSEDPAAALLNLDTRKRSSSTSCSDVIMESPPHKRNRIL